jgi:hypothetical protein
MVSSGMLRYVALVRTDVSEEPGASFIRVTRIGELGTSPSIIRIINSRRMRWAGHVARMGEKRNVYGLL